MQQRATCLRLARTSLREPNCDPPLETHGLMTAEAGRGGGGGCGGGLRRTSLARRRLVHVLVLVLVLVAVERSAIGLRWLPAWRRFLERLAIVGRSAPQRERYRTVAKVPSFVGRFRGTLQRSLARPVVFSSTTTTTAAAAATCGVVHARVYVHEAAGKREEERGHRRRRGSDGISSGLYPERRSLSPSHTLSLSLSLLALSRSLARV